MLADRNAMATIPVKDVNAARKFYEGKLGFGKDETEGPGVVTYKSGNSTMLVYESEFAGTTKRRPRPGASARSSTPSCEVCRTPGSPFEHYELPGGELNGDVHRFGDFKAAWFKDPDGNILHVNSV